MGTELPKLVRDEIPALIRADGDEPQTHIADAAEYETRLREKLGEEVAEYRASQEPAELADVLEVLHAIRKVHGLSVEDLETLREEKAKKRGRFAEGIVLESVE